MAKKEDFINKLKATYFVCLKSIRGYSRLFPFASTVFKYMCHQGPKFLRKNLDHNFHSDKQKQCSIAKHDGCKFAVKIICLNDVEQNIEILVNTIHTDHEPRTKANDFFIAASKRNK